jgi:hypothetical protein
MRLTGEVATLSKAAEALMTSTHARGSRDRRGAGGGGSSPSQSTSSSSPRLRERDATAGGSPRPTSRLLDGVGGELLHDNAASASPSPPPALRARRGPADATSPARTSALGERSASGDGGGGAAAAAAAAGGGGGGGGGVSTGENAEGPSPTVRQRSSVSHTMTSPPRREHNEREDPSTQPHLIPSSSQVVPIPGVGPSRPVAVDDRFACSCPPTPEVVGDLAVISSSLKSMLEFPKEVLVQSFTLLVEIFAHIRTYLLIQTWMITLVRLKQLPLLTFITASADFHI